MSMENISRVIFALNSMIEINDRRYRHYESLADKFKNGELRKLFRAHAEQSKDYTADLNKWRSAYGATTYPEKNFSVFSITWSQVKGAFTMEPKGMLEQCEEIDSDALKVYNTAIALSFLPQAALHDIEEQNQQLKKSHENLMAIRRNYTMHALGM